MQTTSPKVNFTGDISVTDGGGGVAVVNVTSTGGDDDDGGGGVGTATTEYVDLSVAPYSVVVNDHTFAAHNVAAINSAIVANSGTYARLVLPSGIVYIDRSVGAANKWCIEFPVTVSKITLAGQGMRSTMIVRYGTGDAGSSHEIHIQGTEIEICDLGVYQELIKIPDPGNQNHLVTLTSKTAGHDPSHINIHDVFLGKCIGDQFRTFGDQGTVSHIRVNNVVLNGAGTMLENWPASTAVSLYERVINDSGKQYYCVTAGTTASSGGPTGTGAFSIASFAIDSADASTDTITKVAHGLSTFDGPMRLTTVGGLPGGLLTGTDYWIIKVDADHFKLANTIDHAMVGTVVNITSAGTDATVVSTATSQHGIVDGTATWYNDGARTGARSGFSIQAGYSDVDIGNFYVVGVQNSAIDMEPTSALTMDFMCFHDGVLDNRSSNTSVVAGLGGTSGAGVVSHLYLSNVTMLGGCVVLNYAKDCQIDNCRIVTSGAIPGTPGAATLLVRNNCDNLKLTNLYLERIGGTASNVLDLINPGTSTTIKGVTILQGTNGYPIYITDTSNLNVSDVNIAFSGATPASYDGIVVLTTSHACDDVSIDNIRASTASGKLRAAVTLAQRTTRSFQRPRVTRVVSAGYATSGVYVTATAIGTTTMDRSPYYHAIQNGADTTWNQGDQNDSAITTLYPMVAGNPGDIARYVCEAAPESALTARQGCVCTLKNGDSTVVYFKKSGTGNTGWLVAQGVAATGTIVCIAKASLVDTDFITIGDGLSAPKRYEFDTAGDGVSSGIQVNVSTDTTATQVGARLVTAINANHPVLTAVNASGTITVTHKLYGVVGNVTITENVANAGFTVAGLSGGVDPSV